MLLLGSTTEKVVISEPPLRDSNRVVLQADAAAVIEHRNASGVMRPGVIGLLEKWHVVFAECASGGVRIYLGNIVPEIQMTILGEQIGSEYAPIIVQPVRSGQVQSDWNFCTIARGRRTSVEAVFTTWRENRRWQPGYSLCELRRSVRRSPRLTTSNSNRRALVGQKSSLLLAILEEGMEPESDCAVKRARGSFASHLS